MIDKYNIEPIRFSDCKEWFLKKHYAHSIPPCNYIYGLFGNKNIIGICSYGVPSSSPLKRGIAGENYKNDILELNRLILSENKKNQASYFISKTLKLLPRPKIIVSYADTAMNHHGYIYQACNFIYTGLSAKRTDWKIKGMENLHGQTIADMSRGEKNRVEFMRDKFGDNFYLEDRPRKHRYIYFIGTKKEKKEMLKSLNYKIIPYPKGDNKKYDASYEPSVQRVLF